jgi:hypothetical protein
MEAALHAATLGLPWTLYERGRVGEHFQQWGWAKMFTPFAWNVTPLGLARLRADDPHRDLPAAGDLLTGRDYVAAYLETLAASPLLKGGLHQETAVLRIGRRGLLKGDFANDPRRGQAPFRLLLRDKNGWESAEEADVVLDCTGVYGNPRWLGDGGVPAIGEAASRPHIAVGLEDVRGERRDHYADKTTLVVGGGPSAATTVSELAALAEKHPATWVIWLARGDASQPVRRFADDPLKERDRVAVRANTLATRGDGAVEFHPRAAVEAVEKSPAGFKVTGRCAGKTQTWEVDRIIGAVGFGPDAGVYRELQVTEHPVTQAAAGGPRGALAATAEPNYYVLGHKGVGRDPAFLLPDGFVRVREAFAHFTSHPDVRKRFPLLARLTAIPA